jgi:hypothetical protein
MVKKLFGLAVFALILAAFLGAAPAAAAEIPGVTAVAAVAPSAGGCGQAPVLPAKGETCSSAQPESVLPGVIAPSARLGYCHCGCTTQRCHTSADCGGASCDATISCC